MKAEATLFLYSQRLRKAQYLSAKILQRELPKETKIILEHGGHRDRAAAASRSPEASLEIYHGREGEKGG